MIKKLPVLYKTENNLFREVEIKKPSGKVISDTKDNIENKNKYIAMRTFVADCTIRIIGENSEITDPLNIKSAYDKMSNKNLEYLSKEIMILYYDGDDYIEGLYICPRCGNKVIAEKRDEDGIEIDTRDRISDLKVTFMEDESELIFDVDFSKPVTLTSEMEDDVINNITMCFPTTESLVKAYNSVGDDNDTKLQYYIWAYSILKANGKEVDTSWRRSFGVQLFNNVENVEEDLNKNISGHINKYGVDPRVTKNCRECGKTWRPYISTSNFFASALQ